MNMNIKHFANDAEWNNQLQYTINANVKRGFVLLEMSCPAKVSFEPNGLFDKITKQMDNDNVSFFPVQPEKVFCILQDAADTTWEQNGTIVVSLEGIIDGQPDVQFDWNTIQAYLNYCWMEHSFPTQIGIIKGQYPIIIAENSYHTFMLRCRKGGDIK